MNYSYIARQGLWTNNPAMVQLLGLCPLLAVSTNLVTALGLGVVTLLVLTAANISISLTRRFLADATRLPLQILVIATFVTLADLLLQAYLFELHQRIGLFVALIVTNCTLLGRAEAFASKNPVLAAAWDGLMMGLGFLLVLVVLGGLRELLGHGTLFANMDMLLGKSFAGVHIQVANGGFLLALLPPGAFLIMGCLMAVRNLLAAMPGSSSIGRTTPDTKSAGTTAPGAPE